MKNSTKKPEGGQDQRWQGYILFAAIVIAAGIELASYITFANRNGGPIVVGVAVVMWIGLMALPWNSWYTAPFRGICLAMAILTSLSNLTMLFGETMNGRIAVTEKHESAKADAERARRTLSGITETGSVVDLEAIVANAKTAYETAAARDTKLNGDTPACYKACRGQLEALQKAQISLGNAKTRDKVEADLRALTRLQDENPAQDANALAATLAPHLGMDAKKLARDLIMGFCVLGVIVATGMSTMGQLALKMINSGQPRPKGGQGPKGGKPMPAQTEAQASNVVSIEDEKKKRATPRTAPQKAAKNAVLKAQLAALLAKGLSVNEAARQIDYSKRSTFQR